MYEKLGGDEDADSKMGELSSGIGSLLATEAAIGEVRAPSMLLFDTA